MILFDDLSKVCNDVALAHILSICKNILKLIQIAGPILAIIGLIITLVKYVADPLDKKLKNKLRNCLIALVILFFIPTIVNAVMILLDDSFSLTVCWNYVEDVYYPLRSTYIENNNSKKVNFIVDPNKYDSGEEPKKPSSNNNSSSNNSNSNNNVSNSSIINNNSGLGGQAEKITIKYNVKDSMGRCGKGSNDKCAEIATVKYPDKTIKYYMGYQNNSKLLGGSCRAHAFTCGMNAVNDTYYSTLDLQNYLFQIDNGVLSGRTKFNSAINHFKVNAKAYFNETSIPKAISLAGQALDNGQPVMIFVAHSKCSDLAGTHHALLLIGYDNNGDVVFLDSCSRYPSAKKRNLKELEGCMSQDSVARSYMRMVIFSFN